MADARRRRRPAVRSVWRMGRGAVRLLRLRDQAHGFMLKAGDQVPWVEALRRHASRSPVTLTSATIRALIERVVVTTLDRAGLTAAGGRSPAGLQ